MSYRDDNEGYDGASGRKPLWYWPALDSLDESYEVARKSFGGWAFAVMLVLGAAITFFSGKRIADLQTPEANVPVALMSIGIELLFVLFAAYRIRIGRGWIVSWVLLAAFGGEAVMKMLDGHSFGWIIFYIGVGSSILAGARACWDIRSRQKAGETRRTGEELQTVFE